MKRLVVLACCVAPLSGATLTVATMPAHAEELRDYCPERPGLNTPACTIDRGHLSVETGLADWTRERDPDAVTDTTLIGDTLLRYGLGDTIEAQLGWTPLGIVRTRDRTIGGGMAGGVTHQARVGDVTIGLKANLAHPDGKGFAIALLPSVSLPVGRAPVGAGDWGAGLRVPMNLALTDAVQLIATPEMDAAVDEDGDGRHLAYGGAGGVQVALTEALSIAVEGEAMRDRDPSGRATLAFASASVAWQPRDDLQLDGGVVGGLNRSSPDLELYVGVSRRF